MGFAIPINTAKDIVDEIIQNGYVSGRPSIGITGQNVESADGKVSGVQVYSIDSRAKAASEGLQVVMSSPPLTVPRPRTWIR